MCLQQRQSSKENYLFTSLLKNAQILVKIYTSLFKLLGIMDAKKRPSMDFVYGMLEDAKTEIRQEIFAIKRRTYAGQWSESLRGKQRIGWTIHFIWQRIFLIPFTVIGILLPKNTPLPGQPSLPRLVLDRSQNPRCRITKVYRLRRPAGKYNNKILARIQLD